MHTHTQGTLFRTFFKQTKNVLHTHTQAVILTRSDKSDILLHAGAGGAHAHTHAHTYNEHSSNKQRMFFTHTHTHTQAVILIRSDESDILLHAGAGGVGGDAKILMDTDTVEISSRAEGVCVCVRMCKRVCVCLCMYF